MIDKTVSQETKLSITKDIVANYLRSDNQDKMTPDEVCAFFDKVYATIEKTSPEPKSHRVGLA